MLLAAFFDTSKRGKGAAIGEVHVGNRRFREAVVWCPQIEQRSWNLDPIIAGISDIKPVR